MIPQAADHVRSVNARSGNSPVSASGRAPSRRAFVGALALLAGTSLAGCAIHRTTWTEKLTVVVTTPAGEVSGSAVRWQSLSEDPVLNLAHGDMRGEAVVVEVAKGRYLFALMQDNKPQAELMFFPGEPPVDAAPKLRRMKRQAREVPRNMYPLLVAFDDLKVPASVKQVDPDNLAAAFGEGYALTSIALEIVDEPVTRGEVEKILPWILSQEGSLKPAELRLGTRVIYEAEVLPIEKIQAINFVWWIK